MVVAVPSFRVVPDFNPLKDCCGELVAAGPLMLVEEFSLQDREERFSNTVVAAITNRAHRAEQAGVS